MCGAFRSSRLVAHSLAWFACLTLLVTMRALSKREFLSFSGDLALKAGAGKGKGEGFRLLGRRHMLAPRRRLIALLIASQLPVAGMALLKPHVIDPEPSPLQSESAVLAFKGIPWGGELEGLLAVSTRTTSDSAAKGINRCWRLVALQVSQVGSISIR